MFIFIIVWLLLGYLGTRLIINADYPNGFWKEVTYKELLVTTKWFLLGPITLFLCLKWMWEEEGLGDKKVIEDEDEDTEFNEGC